MANRNKKKINNNISNIPSINVVENDNVYENDSYYSNSEIKELTGEINFIAMRASEIKKESAKNWINDLTNFIANQLAEIERKHPLVSITKSELKTLTKAIGNVKSNKFSISNIINKFLSILGVNKSKFIKGANKDIENKLDKIKSSVKVGVNNNVSKTIQKIQANISNKNGKTFKNSIKKMIKMLGGEILSSKKENSETIKRLFKAFKSPTVLGPTFYDEILNSYNSENKKNLKQIAAILDYASTDKSLSKDLFESVKIGSNDLNQILNDLSMSDIDKKVVNSIYKKFSSIYKAIVEKNDNLFKNEINNIINRDGSSGINHLQSILDLAETEGVTINHKYIEDIKRINKTTINIITAENDNYNKQENENFDYEINPLLILSSEGRGNLSRQESSSNSKSKDTFAPSFSGKDDPEPKLLSEINKFNQDNQSNKPNNPRVK